VVAAVVVAAAVVPAVAPQVEGQAGGVHHLEASVQAEPAVPPTCAQTPFPALVKTVEVRPLRAVEYMPEMPEGLLVQKEPVTEAGQMEPEVVMVADWQERAVVVPAEVAEPAAVVAAVVAAVEAVVAEAEAEAMRAARKTTR